MIPREKLAHDYLCALLYNGRCGLDMAISSAFTVADRFAERVEADRKKDETDTRLPMASSRPFRPGGTEK